MISNYSRILPCGWKRKVLHFYGSKGNWVVKLCARPTLSNFGKLLTKDQSLCFVYCSWYILNLALKGCLDYSLMWLGISWTLLQDIRHNSFGMKFYWAIGNEVVHLKEMSQQIFQGVAFSGLGFMFLFVSFRGYSITKSNYLHLSITWCFLIWCPFLSIVLHLFMGKVPLLCLSKLFLCCKKD